jgi:peptidoglycan/xylan/chitin deacetylase (PgdA/CDA1 family)
VSRRAPLLRILAVGAALTVIAGLAGFVAGREIERHPSPTARVFARPEPATGRVGTEVMWRVQVDQPIYALTFDDGPDPSWTPRVLEILARHGARATFFELGAAAQAHPDLVRAVVAAGHEVASHGWDHSPTTTMAPSEIGPALARADQALTTAGAPPVSLLRPTYGRIDQLGLMAAAALGYRVILWSHALHGGTAGAAEVPRIVAAASPGMIVLCHDGRSEPDEALMTSLDDLLTGLEAAGYRTATVGELLAAGTPQAAQ